MKKKVKTVGIVGANLTSLLLCIEASKRGIETILLDQMIDNIAADQAGTNIVGKFDRKNLERLALRVDSIIFTTNLLNGAKEELDEMLPTYPNFKSRELLTDRVKQLVLASEFKIAVPEYFICKDEDDLMQVQDVISIPYRCHQYLDNNLEVYLVEDEEMQRDVKSLINVDEGMCIFEQISNYKQVVTITGLKDNRKNIVLYPISEEEEELDNVQSYIFTPANITKSNAKKIEVIARKIIKHMNSAGMFTFKFGITKDKKIEWIGMTPGVNVGDIHTNHFTQLSVYEQFFNIVENKPIINVDLLQNNCVCITDEMECADNFELPYHLYRMKLKERGDIQIFVVPDQE